MDSSYRYSMMPPESIAGLLELGNIDLYTRPRVQNDDGSYSTVRSMSFGDENGREILIPTVSDDGYIMSDNDAINRYYQTGKHLGIFNSPDAATAYAERLHELQEQYYNQKRDETDTSVIGFIKGLLG
jgi:hypothetical protein